MRIVRTAFDVLGELIAPARCAACDEPVRARVLFCPPCGVSAIPADLEAPGQYAVFEYGGSVAAAIVRFKYAGRSDLIARFAELVSARVHGVLAGQVEVVVPVPLHPKRLVERGFNQAALLAGPVARGLRAAFAPRAIARTRETPPQASLDRAARAANVAAAFRCAAQRAAPIAGARILLVDDVRTTGATLAACTRALLDAGAREVLTLVLASRGPENPGPVQEKPGKGHSATD